MKFRYLGLFILIVILFISGCTSDKMINEESSVDQDVSEVNQEDIETPTIIDNAVPIEDTTATTPETIVEQPQEEPVVPAETTLTSTTHLVKIEVKGFNPTTLTIKAGDTVEFENVRTGNLNKAMISGTQSCVNIKSAMLNTGDKFSHTFETTQTCTLIDVITTTQIMKIIVE